MDNCCAFVAALHQSKNFGPCASLQRQLSLARIRNFISRFPSKRAICIQLKTVAPTKTRIQTQTETPIRTRSQTPIQTLPLLGGDTHVDPDRIYSPHISLLSDNPPLYHIKNFLTPSQCDALISAQTAKTDESSLYLNYRVNKEVHDGSASQEANELIQNTDGVQGISAMMRSGFRVQVDPAEESLDPVLDGIRNLFGWQKRQFVFEEGAWIRPNRSRVVVRDQTTVRYEVGEGVPPHIDGKDVTVLVCLEEAVEGGHTVFPEEGQWVKLARGCALVYRSRGELLHFAEAVGKGRKWVLQLLIDCRVRHDEIDVELGTGSVLQG